MKDLPMYKCTKMFMVRVACSSAAASLEVLDKEYVDRRSVF